MSKPTVRRKDITLTEVTEWSRAYDTAVGQLSYTSWEATLNGRISTGEYVEMTRTAEHAGEALTLLEEAIKENGWDIR